MKYNTIGAVNGEKKASLTIYADMDLSQNKMANTEITNIRSELEIVQKALKLQTKRCRQLVTEFTRRLQQKEQQYQSEKTLRNDQLAKVLRALIIFEARLKQEQKFISHQLKEKDQIIKKQNNEIKKLLANQYCKNCNQYYTTSSNLESLDSSSEYVITDYQSSNFESLESSSDIYATISEKSYDNDKGEDNNKIYIKNKGKDSLGRRGKKFQHKKSVGSYFEVLKLRNESSCSNEDNTSNDYDNLESLPPESLTDKISIVSDQIETLFTPTENIIEAKNDVLIDENKSKITEAIPIFDIDAGETNDNWYASASDQEDDEQRDIYRNNPVLECMNQILLQNINSPPKTPNPERKSLKKVKFSDEEKPNLTKENLMETTQDSPNYYETPIQKIPNFYETPQSIYSNDYEQILSKCSETFTQNPVEKQKSPDHFYVDLDQKNEEVTRKMKILRTPPALPPKPANLLIKYKLQAKLKDDSLESEPDYCSISELNLPTTKNLAFKKINVIAEINPPNSQDVINKLEKSKPKSESDYDPVGDTGSSLIVKKCVEKFNIQLAKQTSIKSDPKKPEPEIPKLPQVSEIIIPDENTENRINHDNYIKNNSQILKSKTNKFDGNRRSVIMGSSVSSLISGFNSQLISEINKKPEKKVFTSFDNLEKSTNFDKFDLSQNFEEFKLDDCEIEEFNVNDIPDVKEEDVEASEEKILNSTRVELIRATNDSTVPALNVNSVEMLKRQLELQKNKISNEVVDSQVQKGNEPTYEHFLECTGLSSKSILTPTRLLSNHKSMLKPKDIKLRSKVNKGNLMERHSTGVIKYWSEPYI